METRPKWLAILPGTIRADIEHRPKLLNALSNTGWLFGDRLLRMGMGLLVGAWMARYLGPEQFGLFNYAIAFAALFSAIATLGLNGIVVRDLVKEPESADITLGTTFLLQILGGLLALACAIVAITLARPDDTLAKLMVSVLGFAMVFRATEVVKYWFESQVQTKYTVWSESGVFLLFCAIRIFLILKHAPLMAFVWASFAEGALAAAGLLAVYVWRRGSPGAWRLQYERAISLLKDSWPLILSGLAIMLYMRIDQIMLGQMLGDEAVGIYSAAVRISEVWYFIPIAIASSVFPAIIETKKQSEHLYSSRLQQLYDLMALLSLLVAITMTFLSGQLIVLLFGQEYTQSGSVLAIHVWAGVGVAISAVHGKWLLAEDLQKYGLLYTTSGCLINLVLNFYLIPRLGLQGAAYATVLAQTLPYLLLLRNGKTRVHLMMIVKSFSPVRLASWRTGS